MGELVGLVSRAPWRCVDVHVNFSLNVKVKVYVNVIFSVVTSVLAMLSSTRRVHMFINCKGYMCLVKTQTDCLSMQGESECLADTELCPFLIFVTPC